MMGRGRGAAKEGVGRLRRMPGRCLRAVLLLLAAMHAPGCSRAPAGPHVSYLVQTVDGQSASEDDLRAAASVVDRRLEASGFDSYSISPDAEERTLTIELPAQNASKLGEACRVIERNATLEFRILASEQDERALRNSGSAVPPPSHRLVPCGFGGPDMLVEIPEGPAAAELADLRKRSIAETSPEFVAAQARFDGAVRENVFTGEQIARCAVTRQHDQNAVSVEFTDDRKPLFESFTERNVRRQMAIILDGVVSAAPIVTSRLPGVGVITGGGLQGFTPAEARELATALGSERFPGHLVRVTHSEAK